VIHNLIQFAAFMSDAWNIKLHQLEGRRSPPNFRFRAHATFSCTHAGCVEIKTADCKSEKEMPQLVAVGTSLTKCFYPSAGSGNSSISSHLSFQLHRLLPLKRTELFSPVRHHERER
jgi:hypothetical protein